VGRVQATATLHRFSKLWPVYGRQANFIKIAWPSTKYKAEFLPGLSGGPGNEQGQQDSKSKPYRSRLAALAENINNWEDDLSHPQIK